MRLTIVDFPLNFPLEYHYSKYQSQMAWIVPKHSKALSWTGNILNILPSCLFWVDFEDDMTQCCWKRRKSSWTVILLVGGINQRHSDGLQWREKRPKTTVGTVWGPREVIQSIHFISQNVRMIKERSESFKEHFEFLKSSKNSVFYVCLKFRVFLPRQNFQFWPFLLSY